jgi:hypothetical protein
MQLLRLQGLKHCHPWLYIVCQNSILHVVVTDKLLAAELHEVIKFTIPNLKALLKNHDSVTHVAVVDALSILAGYCWSE